jgi:hypothetical protein
MTLVTAEAVVAPGKKTFRSSNLGASLSDRSLAGETDHSRVGLISFLAQRLITAPSLIQSCQPSHELHFVVIKMWKCPAAHKPSRLRTDAWHGHLQER